MLSSSLRGQRFGRRVQTPSSGQSSWSSSLKLSAVVCNVRSRGRGEDDFALVLGAQARGATRPRKHSPSRARARCRGLRPWRPGRATIATGDLCLVANETAHADRTPGRSRERHLGRNESLEKSGVIHREQGRRSGAAGLPSLLSTQPTAGCSLFAPRHPPFSAKTDPTEF
jgi:hypothetical protein